MIQDVAPDVPARVYCQDDDHGKQEPQTLLPVLFDCHELVHAIDQINSVNKKRTAEPNLKISAVGLIVIHNQVERNEEDDHRTRSYFHKLSPLTRLFLHSLGLR
jgi:hypothetical protein